MDEPDIRMDMDAYGWIRMDMDGYGFGWILDMDRYGYGNTVIWPFFSIKSTSGYQD